MKLKIIDTDSKEKGNIELPKQFEEDIRPDIIKRAVLVLQAKARTPYGTSIQAGKRASAMLSKRRRKYRGCYNKGISRTPRKILTRRGSQMYMVGAFAPNTIGGRVAHPPKVSKNWELKINKKENRKAIRSAISATLDKETVKARGHVVPENYPFIIKDSIESLKKTSEIKKVLKALGFEDDLKRCEEKKKRAGRGKSRGRRFKRAKSLLLVTSKDCELHKAAKNIPGIEIIEIKRINAETLAPGANPGRATLFTESAIKILDKEKLFI